MGRVFVKAFDDRGNQYPIAFDDARAWLHFEKKDNALKTFKDRFRASADYEFKARGVLRNQDGSYLSVDPDKYYLTINAFERFAMAQARTEVGDIVRNFFRAIRDAYVELTTSLRSTKAVEFREKAFELLFEGQGCLYLACVHESNKL